MMEKRKPGRPPSPIDWDAALNLASMGASDAEIHRAIGVSLSSYMRYLRVGDRRDQLQRRRSGSIAAILTATMKDALSGKTGSANFLLGRLEGRRNK